MQASSSSAVILHPTSDAVVTTASSQASQHQVDLISLAMTALRLAKSKSSSRLPRVNLIGVPDELIITLDEVSWHDNAQDCWIIIYDRVYDVTEFLNEHPGGCDVLLENAGRDATLAFRGAGHTRGMVASLKRFQIGRLPPHECLFGKNGVIKCSDQPDY